MLGVAPAPCPGWVRRSWGSALVGGSALAWDSAPWACGAVLRLPWACGGRWTSARRGPAPWRLHCGNAYSLTRLLPATLCAVH